MTSLITVTAPATGITSLSQGSILPVSWTTGQLVTSGEFSIWALSAQGLFYGGKVVAANPASTSYVNSLTLDMPVGTGYSIYVYYRALPTSPWGPYGSAPGTVDVTAANLITVTSPWVPERHPGAILPVTWTTSQLTTTGEFSIWLRDSGGLYYGGKIVAPNPASTSYADSIAANVPVGVGYTVYVYYRAAPTDPWGIYGQSTGTVTVM